MAGPSFLEKYPLISEIERLLPELLEQILLRVPAKSLARCKSVCKPWFVIINNPSFYNNQFALVASGEIDLEDDSDYMVVRNRKLEMYLLERKKEFNICRSFDVKCPFFDDAFGEVYVKGSAKGFLCVTNNYGVVKPNEQSDYLICVYNPVTEECIMLPQVKFSVDLQVKIDVGFGFVESTNEFKVVIIISWLHNISCQMEVQVFTLGSIWRTIECPANFYTFGGDGAVFLNGLLHWRSIARSTSITHPCVIAFDIENEIFGFVHVLKDIVKSNFLSGFYIGVLEGCLYIVDHWWSDLKIWILKTRNGENFGTRVAAVKNDIFFPQRGFNDGVLKPIVSRENGDIVLLYENKHLISYNPGNGKRTPLDYGPVNALDNNSQSGLQVCPYIASSFHLRQYAELRSNK